MSGVVQARSRDRREGREASRELGPRHDLPRLDRAPVVSDGVRGAVRARGVEDGDHVEGELAHVVALARGGGARGARSAHVVGDDVEVAREPRRDSRPDLLGVGVAVDEEDGRTPRVACTRVNKFGVGVTVVSNSGWAAR